MELFTDNYALALTLVFTMTKAKAFISPIDSTDHVWWKNLQNMEQSVPRVAFAMAYYRDNGCTSHSRLGAMKLEAVFCYFG